MGTANGTKKWYTRVLACFDPDDNITDVGFLKLFAGAMCVPPHANYGKTAGRKSGAAAKAERRLPDRIWLDQLALLSACTKVVEQSAISGGTVKQRLENIAELLMNATALDAERKYAEKNSNYSAKNYLSLYLYPFQHATDTTAAAILPEVLRYYECLLAKIFEGDATALCSFLNRLREQLMEVESECDIPGFSAVGAEAAWYLSALLLLCADQNYTKRNNDVHAALMFDLLGVVPVGQGSTRSVINIENVTLTPLQFQTLCAAALRADPNLNELHAVFEMLELIVQKTDYQLDDDFRALIEQYIRVLKALYDRNMAAADAQDDWLGQDYLKDASVARYLAAESKKWIT